MTLPTPQSWAPETPSTKLPTKNTFIDFGLDSDSDSEEEVFAWSWPSAKRCPMVARGKHALRSSRPVAASATTGTPWESEDEQEFSRRKRIDSGATDSEDDAEGRVRFAKDMGDNVSSSDDEESDEDEYVARCRMGLEPLPSAGSAGHFDGTCRRCCFHPKGRCENGVECTFCHFDHDKRRRCSKKKNKKSRRRRSRAAARAARESEFVHVSTSESAPIGKYAVRVPTHQQELDLRIALVAREALCLGQLQQAHEQAQLVSLLMTQQYSTGWSGADSSASFALPRNPAMETVPRGPLQPCAHSTACTAAVDPASPSCSTAKSDAESLGHTTEPGTQVQDAASSQHSRVKDGTLEAVEQACKDVSEPVRLCESPAANVVEPGQHCANSGPSLAWVMLPTGEIMQVIVADSSHTFR